MDIKHTPVQCQHIPARCVSLFGIPVHESVHIGKLPEGVNKIFHKGCLPLRGGRVIGNIGGIVGNTPGIVGISYSTMLIFFRENSFAGRSDSTQAGQGTVPEG